MSVEAAGPKKKLPLRSDDREHGAWARAGL